MRALAWDDKELDFLETLGINLKKYGIKLEYTKDADEFAQKFLEKEWSFVILDIYEEGQPSAGDETEKGFQLAKDLRKQEKGKDMPIIFLTRFYNLIAPKMFKGNFPKPSIIKSKTTALPWLAAEINEVLKKEFGLADRNRVFLIYGHEREAYGVVEEIEETLTNKGVTVEKVSSNSVLTDVIINELIKKMSECYTVIAICTPDDELCKISKGEFCSDPDERKQNRYQPRPNVFTEIGIAIGLKKSINRLLILKKVGSNNVKTAELSSDFGGMMYYEFNKNQEAVEKTIELLKKMGVQFSQ